MAKSVLDIVIRFAKEGEADKETVRALVNIKSSVVQAMGVMTALAGVGYTLNQVYQKTVQVFQDYAFQVLDLSRISGTSVEDSSRMIQMADDLRMSYENLQKSLWFASKNGVEVNIESLARLAGQYTNLNSATEQATFLTKTFGKGSADMGRLMELGTDGVLAKAAAVEKSMILDEQATNKASALYKATDELSDSWKGLTVVAGGFLTLPILVYLSALTEAFSALNNVIYGGGDAWAQFTKAAVDNATMIGQMINGTYKPSVDALKQSVEDETTATEAATAAALAYKTAMSDLSTMISGDLGTAYDNHLQKIADLDTEMGKARGKKAKGEVQAEIDAETAAYDRQTNSILYNIQSQIIMRNTDITDEEKLGLLTQLASGYGLIDEKTRAAMDATNGLVSAYLNQDIGADEFIDKLRGMTTDMGKLTGGIQEGAGNLGTFHTNTGDAKTATEEAKEPLDNFASSMSTVKEEAKDAAGQIADVKKQAIALDGMVAVVTVIIDVIGEMPSMTGVGAKKPGQNVAQCFAAGTPVRLADGSDKPIETIEADDIVLSCDLVSLKPVHAGVRRVFHHPAEEAFLLLNIEIEGKAEPLRVTPEHMMYVNGEWKPAAWIRTGDVLRDPNFILKEVLGVTFAEVCEPVYNLETDHETHNYFAGGVLVHNGKAQMASGGQWMPGEWALVGDMPGGGIGPYTEAIDPWGYIHSASETRRLAGLGFLQNAGSLYVPEGWQGSERPRVLRVGGMNAARERTAKHDVERLSGGESLGAIMAPLQESAAVTESAVQVAARASDRMADQSMKQTDVTRDGNAQIVERLDQLLRQLPQAMQDAVKLIA